MARAEISISLIFTGLIAIISITLLLGIFGAKLPGMGKQLYCSTVFKIQKSTYVPVSIRADPSYCKSTKTLRSHLVVPIIASITRFSDGWGVKRLSSTGTIKVMLPNATFINATLSLSASSTDVSLDFWSDGNDYSFTSLNSEKNITFIENLTQGLPSCTSFPCTMKIDVNTGGAVIIRNLNITYSKCFFEEELVAASLACWKSANYGDYSRNLSCDELMVSSRCRPAIVTKNSFDETLKRANAEETLPPAKVEFMPSADRILIEPSQNYLVEFSSGKITIS